MPVHVLDHPLAAHILTHLRDKTTKPATFRTLSYQLSLLLAIESTSDIETEEKQIDTPLESITARVLCRLPLVVVPILRAGLGMVQPFTDIFPDVSVGYVGLERTTRRPKRAATIANCRRSPADMSLSWIPCSPPGAQPCRRSRW